MEMESARAHYMDMMVVTEQLVTNPCYYTNC